MKLNPGIIFYLDFLKPCVRACFVEQLIDKMSKLDIAYQIQVIVGKC